MSMGGVAPVPGCVVAVVSVGGVSPVPDGMPHSSTSWLRVTAREGLLAIENGQK